MISIDNQQMIRENISNKKILKAIIADLYEDKKVKKESYCISCKCNVLCGNDINNRLRLGRCGRSSHKHLEHSQIADSVGGEQCCFSVP